MDSVTFNEYLVQSTAKIPILWVVFNLVLSGVYAYVLKIIYIKYGTTLANRETLARTFVLITMTTMLIITIVKSSLALSLGLVGALSIIRFRAAIKEPEELAYLFLSISLGLGFGAHQGIITTICFILIIIGIVIISNQNNKNISSMYLKLSSIDARSLNVDNIINFLKKYCTKVKMKRLDQSDNLFEAVFLVEYDNYDNLIKTKDEMKNLNENINYTFIDNNNIF